jgi:Flp pilus assembly pilin Flp
MIDRANVLLLELVSAASSGIDRLRREEGQTFVEYALVILLIAVAVGAVATWTPLQDAITGAVTKIKDTINDAPG